MASGTPEFLETPSPVTDEVRRAAREQPSSAPGSGPIPSTADDAEAHWVDALQDCSVQLETLHVQGGLLPPSPRWAPATRARGMATLRHLKEIVIALDAVVGAEMREAKDRNGHDDGDATPPLLPPPITDEAQESGERELVTVPLAEDRLRDAADGDQLPFQWEGEENPPREQVPPVQEEEKPSTQAPSAAPSRPAPTRTRRSTAEVSAASTMGDLAGPVPGASAPQMEPPGSATVADPVAPCSPDVPPTGDGAVPTPQDNRCGSCGSSSLWPADTGSGRIHCNACRAVYNPSTGLWAPGQPDKRQRPPASVPAMDSVTQEAIERRPREVIASLIEAGHTAIDG